MVGLPDFRFNSKSGPLATQPLFDHSKSRLVRISDPHCIIFWCIFHWVLIYIINYRYDRAVVHGPEGQSVEKGRSLEDGHRVGVGQEVQVCQPGPGTFSNIAARYLISVNKPFLPVEHRSYNEFFKLAYTFLIPPPPPPLKLSLVNRFGGAKGAAPYKA